MVCYRAAVCLGLRQPALPTSVPMPADLKFAFRQLAKSPGFAAVAILSLALGIGANTAVFSLVNAVLLEALPVKNPEQLVVFNWLAEENVLPRSYGGWTQREPGTSKTTCTSFSIPTFEAFQKENGTLSEVFAFAPMDRVNVNVDGTAEIVDGGLVVSGNYHRGLGVSAVAGRVLTPDDDKPAAESVAVISYGYWQRRFGGDAAAIGKKVTVNGMPVTIVGVTGPSFLGAMQVGEVVNFTLPFGFAGRSSRGAGDGRRADFWWVRIMGRLKPGATAEQASANLEGVFRETARGNVHARTLPGAPAVDPANVPLPQLRATPGGQGLYEARRGYAQSLRLLMGVVALVLLVACANVANLLLARGATRRREIAVRLALGASRARLIRQLLAESVLLAVLGAAAGLVFATWGTRALIAMQPFGRALQLDAPLDWRVLGFTSAVALATGIIFGLAPALRSTRLNLTEEFQGGSRTLGAGARSALTKSLMVIQVALSLVLLVGAGLFIRTLRNLKNVEVGFNREQLLLFQVDAGANGATGPQALGTYDRMRDRLAALPGVRRASYSRIPLLGGGNMSIGSIVVAGYTPTAVDEYVRANDVDHAYLATLEIPLLRGRDFNGHDTAANAARVAIVNQSFARKYFGTEDVVGQHFGNAGNTALNIEIVGLMRDSRYSSVKSTVPPVAFFPFAQASANSIGAAQFAVRFAGSGTTIAAAVRGVVREIDANVPITNVRTQEEQIDRLFTQERLFARLCSGFGVLALLLAAVGLYGLMAYAVQRRTGEIGLRMALGALPAHVLKMILRESLTLVALGVLVGLGAAMGATRWIASMLFGLPANDPVTYGCVALMLMAVAVIACLLPARRAAKIDPMVALRAE